MKKLVIIPAYNEEKSILQTVEDVQKNAPDFDYLVINDCSTDDTADLCRENGIPYVSLPVNLGIGGAVQTGYCYAVEQGYDMAVQFDGDGQHDASFLNAMADKLIKEEADMVIGSRFIEKEGFQSSAMRRVGISYFSGLIRILTGTRITDPTSGMRLIGKDLIAQFARDYPKDYPEPESVVEVLRQKKKICEMPVRMKERSGGVSSISPMKAVYYMVKVTAAIAAAGLRK